jgi:glucose/arabinose dehydrogenase
VRCWHSGILYFLWALVLGAGLASESLCAAEAAHGLERRVAWNGSRLRGSPEPPLPYTVEKTFTNLTWKSPLYLAEEPGSDRLLVVLAGGEPERPSRILRVREKATATEADRELYFELPRRLIYSVCFDPGYSSNRFLYLFSNGPTGARQRTNRISRFVVDHVSGTNKSGATPNRATEQVVIEWPSSGHDGGDMAFGPDGMFYLTTGDGSTDSDTLNSGQTLDDLLGSVLRLDLRRATAERPYEVPRDNPFVDRPGARPEIWAYGLRNPWRMGIDAQTGRIWVGNNGQDLWETVHLIGRGENYGWSV